MTIQRLDHVQLAMPDGTDDLDALCVRLAAAGHEIVPAETLDGLRRCHTADPFGNRIELIGN